MRPFIYARAQTPDAAVSAAAWLTPDVPAASAAAPAQFLAGGTTLIDLMKLDVLRPATLVDINALERTALGAIYAGEQGLRLGALVRMADAAEHPAIRRDYPAIAQSLAFAASQQLRNMASLGGNVLQKTRCPYFRDTSYANCNRRIPGSGCAALEGMNRQHAVLGTSEQCIATYPSDFAQALVALGAQVEIDGPDSRRSIAFGQLHRPPGDAPHIETTLQPGELITAFLIPAGPWTRRSLYLKVRDRESYEFALASAAVALDLRDGVVHGARIGLGGVTTVPWRARDAESVLEGQTFNEDVARHAAQAAFASARPRKDNAFKVALGQRTLVRALNQAARMEIAS
jgi:xanthine dehydrogenase YagS FAD-binding subunit